MDENFKHTALTNKIIKCFYTVYNHLGFGFLEKVYEKALLIELRKEGLSASRQTQLKVFYNQIEVGDYFADIVVENEVIIDGNVTLIEITTKKGTKESLSPVEPTKQIKIQYEGEKK